MEGALPGFALTYELFYQPKYEHEETSFEYADRLHGDHRFLAIYIYVRCERGL